MAEILNIKVETQGTAKAIGELESLNALAKQLNSTTITIKVDASGLESLNKAQLSVIKSANQRAIAEAKAATAADNRAAAEAKLALQVEKTNTAQAQTALQAEKTATAEANLALQTEKTATAQANLATQSEKTATEQAKTATQAEKTATAEANLAIQTEKTSTAQAKLSAQAEKTATAEANLALQSERAAAQAEAAAVKEEAAAQKEMAETEARIQLQNELAAAKERAASGDVNVKIKEVLDEQGVKSFTETFREAGGVVRTVSHQIKDGVVTATETVTEQFSKAGKTVSWFESIMGDSLTNIVAKMAAWQIVGAGVATVIRSFREAVETMKEVDTQLTNIAKVSNLTSEEIKRIGDSAYDTASKYGVAADEYLKAVYTFQKAGLGDSAEKLGELATKTMLVGDTTAEVATKFLIAANAAWKYGGDIDALSLVVDKADYLNNNYAVSLEDIAQALPIVASTAAQAGLSIEQTMAAITTIVSQTAQSGNRAGTALRAIIMNLAGETGELENGFKVTEETIKSLNGIIAQFRPNAIAAAEAAGTIVDPMEAIAALAEAVEAGVLNSGELFNLVTELAGKLRGNQLNALIQGQETYNKALAGTADAAGTADREIETMLTSWERKTQILSNTWTKFLTNFVKTDLIKGSLDALIGLIKLLDSGIGELAASAAAGAAAVGLLSKAFAGLFGSSLTAIVKDIVALNAGLSYVPVTAAGAAYAAGGLTGAIQALTGALLANPIFWGAVAAGGIYLIVKAFDALTVSAEEHAEAVADATSEYKNAVSELDSIKQKLEENKKLLEDGERFGKSEAYINRLKTENAYLEQQRLLLENNAKAAKDSLAKEARSALTDDNYSYREYHSKVDADIISYSWHLLEAAKASKEYDEELGKLVETSLRYAGALADAADGADNLGEEDKTLYDAVMGLSRAYNALMAEIFGTNDAEEKTTETTNNLAEAQEKAYETADKLAEQCKAVTAALRDYTEYGNLTQDSIDNLKEAIPGLVDALYDEEGKLTDVGREALETASNLDTNRAAVEYLQATVNSLSVANAINQINSLREAAITSATAAIALNNALKTLGIDDYRAGAAMVARKEIKSLDDFLAQAAGKASALPESIAAAHTKSSGGSSRSSSSSASTKDEELEKWKNALTYAKNYYSFLENKGATDEELAEQAREVQNALHDVAEYLRSIGADEADIIQYSSEWWTWQNKITQAQEKSAEAAQKQALAAYKNNVSTAQKQLQIVQALGAGRQTELTVAQKLTASYTELLYQQQASGADEDDIFATVLNIIKAKKSELDLQKELAEKTEDQSDKQKELDEKYLSDSVKLRKTDLDLAKKLGRSTEEIAYYMERYADAIVEQGRWMEQNGASQAEINSLALTYLGVLEDIDALKNGEKTTDGQKKELDYLKSVVTRRESELNLMEAMQLSEDEQIRKYREILDALEKEGDYQREISAEQEEQNETAEKYYNTQKKILSLQQTQLEKLRDEAIAYIDEQEKLAKGPLQEQLDALKAAHEAEKDQREEAEKLLAVEKARAALENAKKQRNVRQYNASSGQWEWIANAKTVQSAEEALLSAQEQLAEYQYKLQIDALQSEIDGISKSFDGLRSAIKDAADGIKNGKYSYEEAYSYISDAMKKLYDQHGVDLSAVMDTAAGKFRDVAGEIQLTYQAIERTALSFGEIDSVVTRKTEDINTSLSNLDLAFGSLGAELNRSDYQLKTAAESLQDTVDILSQLPGEVQKLIASIGSGSGAQNLPSGSATYTGGGGTGDKGTYKHKAVKPDGSVYWITYRDGQPISSTAAIGAGDYIFSAKGDASWSVSPERAAEMNNMISAAQSGSPTLETPVQIRSESSIYAEASPSSNDTGNTGGYGNGTYFGTYTPDTTQTPSKEAEIERMMRNGASRSMAERMYENNLKNGSHFDSGGVLHGLGGIKATREDELVLPPDLTKAVLKPGLTDTVAERLNELGILTGARGISALNLKTGNSIGSQHNGNVYSFGDVNLSEQQADAMTVTQLARYMADMTRDLRLR